jgi:hypothetical protein
MDPDTPTRLEVCIADAGALLVQLGRYRARDGAAVAALRPAAMALGDRARRAHHDGTLAAVAEALLADAEGLVARLREALTAIRSGPEHAAARAAVRMGDRAAIAAAIEKLFADVEVVAHPPTLQQAVPWFRRSRALPPDAVAATIAGIATEGFALDGDDLAPGRDPDLPAAVLLPVVPPGDPVALRVEAVHLPAPLVRLADGDEHLIHGPPLVVPITIVVRERLDDDELETTPVDYPRWRDALVTALAGRGLAATVA